MLFSPAALRSEGGCGGILLQRPELAEQGGVHFCPALPLGVAGEGGVVDEQAAVAPCGQRRAGQGEHLLPALGCGEAEIAAQREVHRRKRVENEVRGDVEAEVEIGKGARRAGPEAGFRGIAQGVIVGQPALEQDARRLRDAQAQEVLARDAGFLAGALLQAALFGCEELGAVPGFVRRMQADAEFLPGQPLEEAGVGEGGDAVFAVVAAARAEVDEDFMESYGKRLKPGQNVKREMAYHCADVYQMYRHIIGQAIPEQAGEVIKKVRDMLAERYGEDFWPAVEAYDGTDFESI